MNNEFTLEDYLDCIVEHMQGEVGYKGDIEELRESPCRCQTCRTSTKDWYRPCQCVDCKAARENAST